MFKRGRSSEFLIPQLHFLSSVVCRIESVRRTNSLSNLLLSCNTFPTCNRSVMICAQYFPCPYPCLKKGIKLLYHTLEKATALLPRGQTQFAVIADCAGFGPSKLPPLEMINIAFSTLQEHYTMRLGYVIIVNASGPITVAWKVWGQFQFLFYTGLKYI